MSGAYDIVWPLAPIHRAQTAAPVGRLDTLDGKRVGFLWDYLFRGDHMFEELEDALRREYPTVTFVDYEAFGNIHGADEDEVIDRLPIVLRRTGVDSVIAAVGA
jgi:hypothetical protein